MTAGVTAQALIAAVAAAGGSFPTVEATANSDVGSGSTSITVTLPTGIVSGSLVLIYVTGSAQSARDFSITNWTQLAEQGTGSSTAVTGAVFYRFCDGGEGASVSCTWTSGQIASAIAIRLAGHHASSAPEASSATTGSTATPDPASLSPSWGSANTLWIAFATLRDSDAFTSYPTSYDDNQLSNTANASLQMKIATRDLAAASEDPGVFTWAGPGATLAYTVAIRPA